MRKSKEAFKEITVEVDTSFEELQKILNKNGFKVIDEYDLNDIYMFKRDCDLNKDPLEILSDSLILRSVLTNDNVINLITYKWKEYNEKREITKQADVKCKVESINDAEHILNIIGYIRLFEIKDHLIIYSNGITEFAVQLVNDKHIYIELEDYSEHLDKYYNTIEDMKTEFDSYHIPIKENNYFVKKAEIELLEILKQNKD